VVRGALSRQQYKDLRQRHDASVVIQKHVRRHALRCSYLLTKKKVVLVQTGTCISEFSSSSKLEVISLVLDIFVSCFTSLVE